MPFIKLLTVSILFGLVPHKNISKQVQLLSRLCGGENNPSLFNTTQVWLLGSFDIFEQQQSCIKLTHMSFLTQFACGESIVKQFFEGIAMIRTQADLAGLFVMERTWFIGH